MNGVPDAVKADLHRLLVALIKIALADDAPLLDSWRETAALAQSGARQALGEGRLDPGRLDAIWTAAIREAENDPIVRRDETVNPVLPAMCPLRPDDLTNAGFDVNRSAVAIRDTASFG